MSRRVLELMLLVALGASVGWAANEAGRIRQAAAPRAWVFFMPISPGDREPNLAELRAALEALGGTVESEFHRREADLYLYRFLGVPAPASR